MSVTTEAQAPILDLTKLAGDRRRREWVTLPDLGRVCVRSMTMSETITTVDLAVRPAIDPRGGVDRQELALWQIALSCYDGDGAEAKRLFDDHQVHLIRNLTMEEYNRLIGAINRVNGQDATEAELLQDFTGAGRAANG